MLKICITWNSCYAFRLHCLDYDVRKSEIIGIYSIQEGNEKYTHFRSGYLKGNKLVYEGSSKINFQLAD